MANREKYIINLKKNKKTTDIIAFSYDDAINHIKLIDVENTDIRIYNEDEKLVYSKIKNELEEINQEYRFYKNLINGEKHEDKREEKEKDKRNKKDKEKDKDKRDKKEKDKEKYDEEYEDDDDDGDDDSYA
jgi:hypothetical protein